MTPDTRPCAAATFATRRRDGFASLCFSVLSSLVSTEMASGNVVSRALRSVKLVHVLMAAYRPARAVRSFGFIPVVKASAHGEECSSR